MTFLQAAQFCTYFKFLVFAEMHFALKSKAFSLSKFFVVVFLYALLYYKKMKAKYFTNICFIKVCNLHVSFEYSSYCQATLKFPVIAIHEKTVFYLKKTSFQE